MHTTHFLLSDFADPDDDCMLLTLLMVEDKTMSREK
jgi:hypothetical protein